LTEELLAEEEEEVAVQEKTAVPVAAISEAPAVHLPSALPPQVAEQIRVAQQRAALSGQGVKAWAIGAKVDARYSHDGLWYGNVYMILYCRSLTSGKANSHYQLCSDFCQCIGMKAQLPA